MGLAVLQAEGQTPVPQTSVAPAFGAQNSSLERTVQLYSMLTGRTVLSGPLPQPSGPVSLQIPSDTNGAIAFIESELAKNRIECVPEGDKFVKLLPMGWRDTPMGAQLTRMKPPGKGDAKSPVGTINFPSIPLEMMLDIYSQMRNRTVLRAAGLPPIAIHLASQQSLTQEEVIYAMETIMALNNIAVVEDGEKFVQVVPMQQALQVRARAPKPEPGADLIEAKKVPEFRLQSAGPGINKPKPLTPTDRAMHYYVWVYTKILGHAPPPPPPPDVDKLVGYYAKMAGFDAQPSGQFGKTQIVMEVRTPLTKAELLYAIETTLALNNLSIVHVEKNLICAGHIAENHKIETKQATNHQ